MPVLAVSADHGSIPDMAGPLQPFTDDLRGETIKHSGHFIPEEQPTALVHLFNDFFVQQYRRKWTSANDVGHRQDVQAQVVPSLLLAVACVPRQSG